MITLTPEYGAKIEQIAEEWDWSLSEAMEQCIDIFEMTMMCLDELNDDECSSGCSSGLDSDLPDPS